MKKFATPLLILISLWVYGQQEIQFTQFMHNRLYYNPGFAGSYDAICLTGVHRSQWVGFTNAPTTQNLNASIPLKVLHGGLGINIVNDQIGFFQDITAGIGYAYQTELGAGKLGIGFQADFRNKNVTSGEWVTPDSGPDGSIPNNGASNMSIDFNFGLYYETPQYWAGLSSGRILETESDLESRQGSVVAFKGKRNIIAMGGYNYELANSNITLTPSIMVKSDLVKTTADIHAGGIYNNKIWGGVTYRLGDALGLMAGYYITPDFKIAYSYDITLSSLRSASSGSHEIVVGYCFKIEIPPKLPGYHRPVRFL